MTGESVPAEVLRAFGVDGPTLPIAGGQGTSIFAGGLVLKPGSDEDETSWLAELCARVKPRGFRLPAPVPSADGRLVVDGWSAVPYVAGSPVGEDDRTAGVWQPVLQAARAFHDAVSTEVRPAFLDRRTHRWAVADRHAWGEGEVDLGPRSAGLLERLRPLVSEEGLADRLVHGDLSGNVLIGGSTRQSSTCRPTGGLRPTP